MSTLRLAVLGPLTITRAEQVIELKIAKVQALLTYLAVTSVPQTRDHLLALLWAESAPEAARKNLRNRLWQLRQTLGEEVIVSKGDKLALAPTVWTDVTSFVMALEAQTPSANELAQALQLWRGPLLEGVQLSEAPEFEVWLTTERERLGQLYRQGLTALLTEQQRSGDWAQMVTLAQRGLTYDPLHEVFHRQLMLAYAQQGARTAALRQYDRLRNLLDQELGLEPLPETIALHTAILNNEINGQGPLAVSRGQRTEDRGQRPENREQRTEDRSQRAEDRGQRTEARGQRTEARSQKPEDRRQWADVRHQPPVTGSRSPVSGLCSPIALCRSPSPDGGA